MKKIQLWSIDSDKQGNSVARAVEELRNTETEEQLEELLVRSPDVLMADLALVGRQFPTDGGPLDLLGIDEDGRLTVFELKRGTLTRDAVSQVIDYASDLSQMDIDRLHRLIEEHSGANGIDQFDDFGDWYTQNHPSNSDLLFERPAMILVGLGVDARTLRMVNFLAESGVDIRLMTFHVFERDGALFLARQVESTSPTTPASQDPRTKASKQANLEALRANATKLGVGAFLEEVAEHFDAKLPAYQWPGKTRYSFSLTERTEQGRPSLRVYVAVALHWQAPGSLRVLFTRRAVDAAGSAMSSFRRQFHDVVDYDERNDELLLCVSPENWISAAEGLESVLEEMLAGWKAKESEALDLTSEREAPS